MKRLKLTIQFDGTNYFGFQKQKQENLDTIEFELEKALNKVLNEEVKIVGCGRTDKKVCAENYICHIDTNSKIEVDHLPFAVNIILPDDIKIIKCEKMAKSFHARYDVKCKTYVYKCYISSHVLPLKDKKMLQLYKMPNIELMKNCAKLFLGTHDFKSFVTTDTLNKKENLNTTKTIFNLDIDSQNDEITFTFCGDGFLHNMVRIIVGTLIEVGYNKKTTNDVKLLFTNFSRKNAGKLVDGKALTLKRVEY